MIIQKQGEEEADEISKEYSPISPDEIELDDLDKYMNTELGDKLSKSAANNVRNTNGSCLGGVDDQFERILGMRSGKPSAYMLGNILASNDGLGKYFGEIKNVTRDQLAKLPGGCVVVWDNNKNGGGSNVSAAGKKHGHISICLGNGQESSDHIQD